MSFAGVFSTKLRIAAVPVLAAAAMLLAQPAVAITYTVTVLGSFGGLNGINASGQVVGSFRFPTVVTHAAVYSGGALVDLGTLGGTHSFGEGINNSGHVTGGSYTNGDAEIRAFLHNGTTMLDLGTLGGTYSSGNGVNASGHVTGSAFTPGNSRFHAFLHNGTTMLDLGALVVGGFSVGTGINDNGHVAGFSTIADGSNRAFLYNGTAMVSLGTLGGSSSHGEAINAGDQVTGYSRISGNTAEHAFLHNGTTMLDLGTLGGMNSRGFGINAAGQVVGYSDISGGSQRAFIYDGGMMQDLTSLLATTDPLHGLVTLESANGINDSGQIIARGYLAGNPSFQGFLLTPFVEVDTPEPASLALLGTGVLAMAGLRRRRRA